MGQVHLENPEHLRIIVNHHHSSAGLPEQLTCGHSHLPDSTAGLLIVITRA
jgi:hypothetical protein